MTKTGAWAVILTLLLAPFSPAQATPTGPGTTAVPFTNRPTAVVPTNPAANIPTTPTAPPSMARVAPPSTFRCARQFMYRGKLLTCDSDLSPDGEKLRPIVNDVPMAVSELNLYQQNRRDVGIAAYTGTFGIALALATWLVSRQMTDEQGNTTDNGRAVRNIGTVVGLGITAGSVFYGLTVLKTNEKHLGNVVKHYNEAKPDDPIELRFSTGISF